MNPYVFKSVIRLFRSTETWSNALTKPGFTKSSKQYYYISINIIWSQPLIFCAMTGYTTIIMNRVPVRSSNIISIGYEEESQLLEIEFKTGRTYRYSSIPPHVYAALMRSESHGKYFLQYISNTYSYIEVA